MVVRPVRDLSRGLPPVGSGWRMPCSTLIVGTTIARTFVRSRASLDVSISVAMSAKVLALEDGAGFGTKKSTDEAISSRVKDTETLTYRRAPSQAGRGRSGVRMAAFTDETKVCSG